MRDTFHERRFSGKGGEVKAKIHVTLKQGILDPQGKAIEHALDSLGFKNAGNVRVGKYMEVDVDEKDKVKAEAEVKAMCEKLLANTIVEEYRYELRSADVKRVLRRQEVLPAPTAQHSLSQHSAPPPQHWEHYEDRSGGFSWQ